MLAALVNTLNPNECPAEIDKIKHTMRTAGVLTIVAQMAADHAQALVDTSPTMETVQRLWRLDRYVVLLNNFCCSLVSSPMPYLLIVYIDAVAW